MPAERSPTLSQQEALSPQGCGALTDTACFALALTESQFACTLVGNPTVANIAGFMLGWRVNVDPADGQAWCPKGELNNSKESAEARDR